jgi:hypothetical protein
MTRCKLINPTNLMLERPMFGPVTEVEFVLQGVKEHQRILRDHFFSGLYAGFGLAACVALIVLAVFRMLKPN